MYLLFFPRAFERRVLPIVGVCYTSYHLHIFSSSPSAHIIFASSHLLSLPLSPLSLSLSLSLSLCLSLPPPSLSLSLSLPLSLSPSLSLSLSLSLFLSLSFSLPLPLSLTVSLLLLFSLKAAGGADEAPRNGHLFARNEVRSSKTDRVLRLCLVRRQPFRTKWGSILKSWRFFATLVGPAATVSHEMRFDCEKLIVFLRNWLVLLKGLCVKVSVCEGFCV